VLFTIDVSEQRGCTVLSVEGEIDVATAPQLRQEAVRLANAGRTLMIIDLSAVGFLDSTGLGVIVGILKRLRTHGGDLAIVGADDHVRKVFEITRISDVLGMYPTVDEACSVLESASDTD
jgi:anti-sigma B factor antagonist